MYNFKQKQNRKKTIALTAVGVILVALLVSGLILRQKYNKYLTALSADTKVTVITIQKCSSAAYIATQLEQNHIIRNAMSF